MCMHGVGIWSLCCVTSGKALPSLGLPFLGFIMSIGLNLLQGPFYLAYVSPSQKEKLQGTKGHGWFLSSCLQAKFRQKCPVQHRFNINSGAVILTNTPKGVPDRLFLALKTHTHTLQPPRYPLPISFSSWILQEDKSSG